MTNGLSAGSVPSAVLSGTRSTIDPTTVPSFNMTILPRGHLILRKRLHSIDEDHALPSARQREISISYMENRLPESRRSS
jgi:hypothetical protein